MMHEACIVKNSRNEWQLLVIGGKVGSHQASCSCTTSVIGIDLKFVLSPWLADKMGESGQVSWQMLSPMIKARANFAHCVVDNLVFVFGGISGNGKGKQSHFPVLASPAIERYSPATDKWEEINIEGAPQLAAFAWTSKGANSGQILVLGGTDGTIIQESAYEIDFKNGKCMELT